MRSTWWLAALLSLCATGLSHAHGGGLDKNGCHNERKTGGYHCHRAPAVVAAPPPTASVPPAKPSKATQAVDHVAQPSPARPTCYTGPRGGTYTITKSGRKNYSGC